MRLRIWVLARYFLKSLFTSLPGALYVILTLAYWLLFFNPQQGTPDSNYYLLVGGIFGPVMGFLITLSIAGQANQATNTPFLVRLPSRIEYLTAVYLSALLATLGLHLLLGLLALFRGPQLSVGKFLEIPPLWIAPTLLSLVLALHASDFVTRGWSRVYVFGTLAVFLFGQSISNDNLARFVTGLNTTATNRGWFEVGRTLANWSNALNNSSGNWISQVFRFPFWPFRALSEAAVSGVYTTTQAIAPAIILLYTTLLFLLAADLFANKDLEFTE